MGVARGGRTGSVWARLWAQTLSFEWPCDGTPFSSFRVRCGVEGCILSVRCFLRQRGLQPTSTFHPGLQPTSAFHPGQMDTSETATCGAGSRTQCVCVRQACACVCMCVTGSCDGELGRSPAFSLHPGLACVACLGTGGRACGSSECRAGRSPVSGLH